MPHRFSTIQAAVEAIAAGKVVIVLDDEDRENEGDYVCAAERVTAEKINLISVAAFERSKDGAVKHKVLRIERKTIST